MAVKRVRETGIELLDAAAALAALGTGDLERVPPSVAPWRLAAKPRLDLIARERIVPHVQHSGLGTAGESGTRQARESIRLSSPLISDAGTPCPEIERFICEVVGRGV